jgi:hypothetical protein
MAELNSKETLDGHNSNLNAETNNEPQLEVFESSNYSHENYDTNFVPQSEDVSESTNNSHENYDTNYVPQSEDVFESSKYSRENYVSNYVPLSEDFFESTINSHENYDTSYVHPQDFSAGDNALYDINYKGNLKENFQLN